MCAEYKVNYIFSYSGKNQKNRYEVRLSERERESMGQSPVVVNEPYRLWELVRRKRRSYTEERVRGEATVQEGPGQCSPETSGNNLTYFLHSTRPYVYVRDAYMWVTLTELRQTRAMLVFLHLFFFFAFPRQ